MKTDFQFSQKTKNSTTQKLRCSVLILTNSFFDILTCVKERRYWLSHHAAFVASKWDNCQHGGLVLNWAVNWQSFDTSWCHTMRMFATQLGAYLRTRKLVYQKKIKRH